MGPRYYIYKRHQWLEVDIETGRIAGGEKASFLYIKRGKLHVAKPEIILRGLKALADGHPTRVIPGPFLPSKRRRHSEKKVVFRYVKEPQIQCCNHASHSCNQPQINIVQQNTTQSNVIQPTNETGIAAESTVKTKHNEHRNTETNEPPIKNKETPPAKDDSSSDKTRNSCETPTKELYIDHDDVAVIKNFLVKHPNTFGDPKRFEYDSEYQHTILRVLNPLVTVDKQKGIDDLAFKKTEDINDYLSLKEFAATLGLSHIDKELNKIKHSYKTRQGLNKKKFFCKDKENLNVGVKRDSRRPDVNYAIESSSETDCFEEAPMKTAVNVNKSEKIDTAKAVNKREVEKERKRASFNEKNRGLREYSSLEDHAIVSWISTGGREACVNGNRVWQELQTSFKNITGVYRTWHSLRNRYLRYILPSLPALSLPPAQQSRLRAAAAKGEIKLARKNTQQRRNSIFKTQSVRSAWSRRLATQSQNLSTQSLDNELAKQSPSPEKRLNRSLQLKKEAPILKKGLTPRVIEDTKLKRLSADKAILMSYNRPEINKPTRLPTYEEVTRRFLRNKFQEKTSSPIVSPVEIEELATEPLTKRRRLFNPKF